VQAEQIQSLIEMSRAALASIATQSGKILYNSVDTLRPGRLYILGLKNPGGDPDRPEPSHQTIADALDRLATKDGNDYIDECWQGCRLPGGRPLQRRVQWLCNQLGHPPRTVCATNLIFIRSRQRNGCGFPLSADLCWPVHQSIIGIVRPRLILSFDSLVYGYVGRRLAGADFGTIETVPSGHGNWQCRRATIPLSYGPVHLVQLPHLSRYAVDRKPTIVEWIRRILGADVQI
jgi:hypothetical protein